MFTSYSIVSLEYFVFEQLLDQRKNLRDSHLTHKFSTA